MRVIAHLASPILPQTAEAIGTALGFEKIGSIASLECGESSYSVAVSAPLFPRREKPKTVVESVGVPPSRVPSTQETKDPFSKFDLRVGRIDDVREHPNADSLFAMTVDLGTEKRSICAGLRGHLKAEELQGRNVLILANLKPAQLRGIESAGMILASDRKDGRVVTVDPGDAKPGDVVAVEGIPTLPKSKISKSDFEKATIEIQAGIVTYAGKPLRTNEGVLTCDAEDGARVR